MAHATDVINSFLRHTKPGDEGILKALKLSPRLADVFWAALNAVAEHDESLSIPKLAKVARLVVNFPSPYIQKLKANGLIEPGPKRGQWKLKRSVIQRLEALLEDEQAQPSAGRIPTGTTTASRPMPAPAAETPVLDIAIPPQLATMPLGDYVESLKIRLVSVNTEIERLRGLQQDIEEILRVISLSSRLA